jgi:anti-sigma regulatory factor (Ser/Thr protein kinase)
VALVVSELVTNAVVHAGTAFTLRIAADHAVVRVSIEDGDQAEPTLVTEPEDRVSGRGMFLIDALVQRWWTETSGEGKTVTAELSLPARNP